MRKMLILVCFISFIGYFANAKRTKLSPENESPIRMCNELNELSIVDHYFIKTIDSIFFSNPRVRFKRNISSYPFYLIRIDPNKEQHRCTSDTLILVWAKDTPGSGDYGYFVYNKHTYIVESPIKAFKQKKKTKTFFYNFNLEHYYPFHAFSYKNRKLTFLEPDDYFDYE